MTNSDIVQKLWNLCEVLRDDGINYSDYVTELVLLLFIKMASENVEAGVMTGHKLPEDCRWSDLEDKSGMSQYSHYRQMLVDLGKSADPLLAAIYGDASTRNEIRERQKSKGWGAKIVARLAEDIKSAFPEIKGFSRTNLMAMRQFAENWPDFLQEPIVRQAVGQIPWGHNLVLLSKLKDRQQRLGYASKALENGWSRNVLEHQIATGFLERDGNAVTNFAQTLPSPTSELAQQTTKNPYIFDFLALGDKYQERELENALIDHISQFLVELGVGFAYIGRQFHLEVGGDDFYIDLLFYHVKLHCYVVVELKTGAFKPADLGQLNFYLTTVDRQVKSEQDAPTIGLLLCRSQNRLVAEYALADMSKPLGIAEYELSKALPADLDPISSGELDSKFLFYALKRLPKGEKLTVENTGYPYIRAGQLKNGTVLEEEQLYISKEVQAQTHINKLSLSILAKAFRGELAPQASNDEPAEQLLARIRAQREADSSANKAKKRTPRSRKAAV